MAGYCTLVLYFHSPAARDIDIHRNLYVPEERSHKQILYWYLYQVTSFWKSSVSVTSSLIDVVWWWMTLYKPL